MKKTVKMILSTVVSGLCILACMQPAAYACDLDGTTPLYSFYSAVDQDHFLTSSYDEANELYLSSGYDHMYLYEGVCWRVETRSTWDNVPVYRFYNALTHDHFYTISETEKTALINALSDGTDHYVYEGIGWYAHSSCGTAVYRLFNPFTYDHYYTTSVCDRDYMTDHEGFNYEGIAWYEQQAW